MSDQLTAPLAGRIGMVHVAVGDPVEEDDEVLIIEALKMENPVFAPCSGTVTEVRVKSGDQVEEDQVLVVIE